MTRRRGFTLIELMLYLSLVTVGLLLIGAVEMTAKRSVDTQQSIIDVQLHGDAFLGRLRRDVELARQVRVEAGVPVTVLGLTLLDGTRVRWGPGWREEQRGDGPARREEFPPVKAWTPRVERVGQRARVTVEVQLEAGARHSRVARKRSRTALTRLEVTSE